jgi:sugar-phosphatase
MIDTLLFDMDGLLVDSEPWWKVAEKEVFGALGLYLDDELLRQVMGFRLNEVVVHWYNYQAWPNPDFAKTEEDIIVCMESLLALHATALPGVIKSLEFAKEKGFKIALASSSSMRLINVVVEKLGIKDYFQLLYSAESEPYGKPHPGIFLSAAQQLGSRPEQCLVIEDSINGMVSAKAAKMQCLVVPEKIKFNAPQFSLADYKLETMEGFPALLTSQPNYITHLI